MSDVTRPSQHLFGLCIQHCIAEKPSAAAAKWRNLQRLLMRCLVSMHAACRANAYLSSLSPPMLRQGGRGLKNLARGLVNAPPRTPDAKRQAECLIVGNQRTEDGLPSGVCGRIFRMVENGVARELWARRPAESAESVPVD